MEFTKKYQPINTIKTVRLAKPGKMPLPEIISPAKTTRKLLRLIHAANNISRVEIAEKLGVNRSTVTEICKPLIDSGLIQEKTIIQSTNSKSRSQGRPRVDLVFVNGNKLFAGVSIGVRRTQVGITNFSGEILAEEDFETIREVDFFLPKIRQNIEKLLKKVPDKKLKYIGVSVPGVVESNRRTLVYAPHLGWKNIDIASFIELQSKTGEDSKAETVPVIVENDAAAAAMFEARVRLGKLNEGLLSDFILVRSGTGIGVGLVLEGELYRGTGKVEGLAGEFGHMTIVAGGKPCVCGNRGCWERYASASSAASLYLGDQTHFGSQNGLRFVEVVAKAEAGEIRARRTLERLGEYLGIGIANVIIGIGIPQVIISGRLVYGWKFIKDRLFEAVEQSMAGKIQGWTVEPGEPTGAGLGGALEVAVDNFLTQDLGR